MGDDAHGTGHGIRGICSDQNGLIYIAVETLNCICVYDMNQNFTKISEITWSDKADPIGVRAGYPYHLNTIFVGDGNDDRVYAFDISWKNNKFSFKKVWKSKSLKDLNHPAGIAVSKDAIYVNSLKKKTKNRYF